ncbi:MAG: hypothetical protein R2815_02890 [Flavobacteriales bacterium]
MKKLLLISLAFPLSMILRAQDQSNADCLVKTNSQWGAPCDHCEYYTEGYKRDFSGTFQLEMKNVCNNVLEVKVAMQEEGGNWRTFPVRALGPQEALRSYACHGTGKYLYWVRRANDSEILLPSDHEILTEYRGR